MGKEHLTEESVYQNTFPGYPDVVDVEDLCETEQYPARFFTSRWYCLCDSPPMRRERSERTNRLRANRCSVSAV